LNKNIKIALAKTASVMASVYSLGLLIYCIASPKDTNYIPIITIFVALSVITFIGFLLREDYGSIVKKIKY
jgi:hypothetical protein